MAHKHAKERMERTRRQSGEPKNVEEVNLHEETTTEKIQKYE